MSLPNDVRLIGSLYRIAIVTGLESERRASPVGQPLPDPRARKYSRQIRDDDTRELRLRFSTVESVPTVVLWPQAVNSGILKLSALTPVLTVYRGASSVFSQYLILFRV